MNAVCHVCGGRIVAASPRFCPHCGTAVLAGAPVHADPERRRSEPTPVPPGRSPLYWLYISWRWLIFVICLGCIVGFFISASNPLLPKREQETLCWIFALGAMFSGAIVLGGIPGAIAHRRAHPYAVVITVCGWIGMLFTGGVLWLIALGWAYMPPKDSATDPFRRAG